MTTDADRSTPSARPGTARTRNRASRAAAALAALALAGSAGVAGAPAAAAADQPTTLRAAMSFSGVDTLNPFLAYFNGALDIFGSVYPTLNSLQPDGTPGPYLATSWKPSDDKLTWTYTLRSGLKWSDGKPITAEDASWTLNLIMTDETAATANGSLVANFEKVTAPDATTLVIRTKKPQSNVPYVSIPVSGIPIVPKHVWEQHTGDLKSFKNDTFPLVGYGPWTLTDFRTEQYAKFTANKDFVLGAPKFDRLVEQSFKSPDAAVAALRSGQLDYVNNIEAAQYKALKGDKDVKAFQEVGNRWFGVELNAGARTKSGKKLGTGSPALGDTAVRSAIALAVDRDTLVAKVIDGLGKPGAGYLPPAWPQWAWSPAGGKAEHDPAKANKLLDDAGYKRGGDGVRTDPKTGRPLVLRLGIHSDRPRDTQASAYLAGWLKDIGVKVDIQALSMSKLNDDLAKGDWDMLMDSWSTGPDPTYLLGIQTCDALPDDQGNGGSTDAFFCDPEYDKLFEQQVTTFDQGERAQVIGKMQDILYKANSDIMLFYANGLDAVRTDTVQNLVTGKADAAGLYPSQTTFWNYITAAPPAKGAKDGSGSNAALIGGGLVAVLVAAGVAVLAMRRRSASDDRE
ncbi:ABC transporter substrate-binding protein [Streptomyces sp. NPDC001380]|uniref:ABC transporter substrate-binding protein n=1 Tax=Streptomyces sp. NPDC001380 TaxID=3364566 RepID=UPI00368FF29A